MRRYKTSEKNRTNYIYYSAEGPEITIHPNDNGVTEALIAYLHQQDDTEYNANRREEYHTEVHLQAFVDGEGEDAEDRNVYLIDPAPNPEEAFISGIDEAELSAAVKDAWDSLLPQQRELIRKKLQGRSNVNIAANENVSEAAIRNRLKKIQDKFKAFR